MVRIRLYNKITPLKRFFFWVNLLGISFFLATATHGLTSNWEESSVLWDGVPTEILPLYAVVMLLSPPGYLLVTFFLLFKIDAKKIHTISKLGFAIFPWTYMAILIPSALWMPLTFTVLASPSDGLWLLIRILLWLVAVASLLLLMLLLILKVEMKDNSYNMAVIGAALLCIQTVLMDAVIWVAFFTY